MKRPLQSIDLVIPIYNEESSLPRSMQTLDRRLRSFDLPEWRIVIVDNGSTDDSQHVGEAMAEQFERIQYERLEIKGRGHALRHAWSTTEAEASLYMDVDLSTGLEAIPKVVEHLEDGADLVVGSRLSPGSETTRSFKREVLSRGYNLLIKALFRSRGFDDAQCGFKAIRTSTIQPILPLIENNEWFFDTELLLVTETAGLDVRSIPVSWVEDDDSRVRIASTVLEDLRGLARVRRSLTRKLGQLTADGGTAPAR